MTRRPLPPFATQFLASTGHAWVAIGDSAWDMPKRKSFPVMVCPPGEDPHRYAWPVNGRVVTVVETGSFDTHRLHNLAYALLISGARRVIAYREALRHERVFPLQVFLREDSGRHAA